MKVSHSHLASFFRQLASLLETGMPVREALEHISKGRQPGNLQALAVALEHTIGEGQSLLDALEGVREAISPVYRAMMIAGEASGRLPEVLQEMATDVEEGVKRTRRTRLAMIYPVFVLIVASAAVVLLVEFVLPRFVSFFESSNAELPPVTQSLLDTGAFLQDAFPLILSAWIALYFVALVLDGLTQGKLLDGVKLTLSPFRTLHRKHVTSAFARTHGMLQEAGVPVVRSVNMAAEASGNRVSQQLFLDAGQRVDEGLPLSEALGNPKTVMPELLVALRSGERTGTVDQTLKRLAVQLDAEIEHLRRVRMIITMNLVLVFLGVMVGWIVIAMMTAYYGAIRAAF